MEAAWKGILTEAERLSDVHLRVKDNLIAGEIQMIKTWQKDNFHKVCLFVNLNSILIEIYHVISSSHPFSTNLDNDANKGEKRNGG